MIETEIKKLRETIETLNGLMVDLIQAQTGVPAKSSKKPKATTTPPAETVAETPATTPAQTGTPPQAAQTSTQQTPVETPTQVTTTQEAQEQVHQAPPATPPGTATLSEWGVYATSLAAQYSAKTGDPAAVMTISQKHGILDIAKATDVQLVPFCDELKALMGIQ